MLKEDKYNIFKEEMIILKKAQGFLSNINSFTTEEIAEQYKVLIENIKFLVKFIKKTNIETDSKNSEFKLQLVEMSHMLGLINTNITIFDTDFKVYNTFGIQLKNSVEQIDENKTIEQFFNLINIDNVKKIKNVLSDAFENNFSSPFDIVNEDLPNRVTLEDVDYSIEFRAIDNLTGDAGKKFLLISIHQAKEEVFAKESGIVDVKEENTEPVKSLEITKLPANFNVTEPVKVVEDSNEEIDILNVRDELTGLYNKTYLDLNAHKISRKAPIGIIIGDMNGLKLANEVFGNQNGDKLLVEVSKIIQDSCFKDEIVVRYSGDEFIIIVFEPTNEICEIICKRIKDKLKNEKWITIVPSITLGYDIQKSKELDFKDIFYRALQNMNFNKLNERELTKKHFLLNIEKMIFHRYRDFKKHIENMEKLLKKFNESSEIFQNENDFDEALNTVRLYRAGTISLLVDINKESANLKDEEFILQQNHCKLGFRLFQSIDEISIANNILYILENWDGSGSPYGLKNTEIPLISRVVAILDDFYRLTNYTYFDENSDVSAALEGIKKKSGSVFDPDLVTIIVQVFEQ